jgi:hypothetical protein
MNQKLLSICFLVLCQLPLLATPDADEPAIIWSTVSPSGTYALTRSKTVSTSSDSGRATANAEAAAQLSIENLKTEEPVLDFSGFQAADFVALDLTDAPPTHWYCAWAPQEDHLLLVSALDPSACLQVDLPEARISSVGSTLVAAAARIASAPRSRKPNFSARTLNLSVIDAHFISSHECYLTINIDSGSGFDPRRVDLYFQRNAGGNSLVFERSEPYPNSTQSIGASILAGRQVERLYQTLRGLLDEDDRQLLTLQQQSWLGGREALANYTDRVDFARMRITELRQKLKAALQNKSAE